MEEEVVGSTELTRVRLEVDILSEQVTALQTVVCGGSKVEEKDIVFVTEMLMRQLLKLDGIEAEGEAKQQRKMEGSTCLTRPASTCDSKTETWALRTEDGDDRFFSMQRMQITSTMRFQQVLLHAKETNHIDHEIFPMHRQFSSDFEEDKWLQLHMLMQLSSEVFKATKASPTVAMTDRDLSRGLPRQWFVAIEG
ncbi:hypothetical protein RJ640_003401 [Escallonia rubra]|uniref:BAG domain-containing protein n=1 Tax=Escallonia rubra TaxID=112253 RepID=A0AA88RMK9_9ASTE|nr:hypothetical protein RJ640_003401 [Escallonia rubra]